MVWPCAEDEQEQTSTRSTQMDTTRKKEESRPLGTLHLAKNHRGGDEGSGEDLE